MARYFPVQQGYTLILADASTTVVLPNGPGATGGQPIALGDQFLVVDNLGTAGGSNIAIKGPIAGGTSGTSISAAYGSALLVWDGNTFLQK